MFAIIGARRGAEGGVEGDVLVVELARAKRRGTRRAHSHHRHLAVRWHVQARVRARVVVPSRIIPKLGVDERS